MSRCLVVLLAVGAAAIGCRTAAPGAVGADAPPRPPRITEPSAGSSSAVARAQAELRDGRLAQAQQLLERAAAETPNDPAVHAGLARVAFANAQLELALDHAGRALALGAGPEMRVLRGRARAFLRQLDGAARELETAVEANPGDVDAWAALVAVQVARGDAHEARRAFTEVRHRAGEAVAVDRAWTQMVGIRPDPVQPQEALDRCARGHAAALAERWNEAQHEYVNGLKRATRFEWCAAAFAFSQARTGNGEGAERGLRRLIERWDPAKPELLADARGMLAEVLLRRGEPGGAAEAARAALAVRPDRAALLETLAEACERAGDAGCARDASARLLAHPHLSPDQRAVAERRLSALGTAALPARAE